MDKIYAEMAQSYYELLTSIRWEDDLLVKGLREGLNKFLSNAYLYKCGRKNKYRKAQYYSNAAKEKILRNDFTDLVFEHMIPKEEYIQKPCERDAKNKKLTKGKILKLLLDNWKIATITKDEDARLEKSMPDGRDPKDFMIRYRNAKIKVYEWDTK